MYFLIPSGASVHFAPGDPKPRSPSLSHRPPHSLINVGGGGLIKMGWLLNRGCERWNSRGPLPARPLPSPHAYLPPRGGGPAARGRGDVGGGVTSSPWLHRGELEAFSSARCTRLEGVHMQISPPPPKASTHLPRGVARPSRGHHGDITEPHGRTLWVGGISPSRCTKGLMPVPKTPPGLVLKPP